MKMPVQIIRWINKRSIKIYYKLPSGLRQRLRGIYGAYRVNNPNRFVSAEIDGIKYNLDLNEEIDNSIYYQGCFEPMTVNLIRRYVKTGMTIIDIGANVGCHTLQFAKLVGHKGRVIAFEPTSYARKKLEQNIKLNKFTNIRVEKIALSNKARKKQRVHFQSSYPLDGVRQYGEDIVDFLTLDEYVIKNKVNLVDFIKMDVDGHEYKIILGGLRTIRQHKPIIIMELGIDTLKKAGDDINDLINTLSDIGYGFYSDKNLSEFKDKKSLIEAIPRIKDGTINVLCRVK